MCGIAGLLNYSGTRVDENQIRRMTCAMSHRGPDADGIFVEDGIALGHRRLSILDLSTSANQPFFDNSGRYVMVFNGEMYNFTEVKSMLKEYEFKTTGDTEVLIAAFAKWGADCVGYFKGMYAFAVWDRQLRELTIVRDRLGVKPVYFYADDKQFVFSSEIRSILSSGVVERKISRAGLMEYLSYQSVGFPHSMIEGITQLEAGTYMRIRDGKIKTKSYWDITSPKTGFDFSDTGLVKRHIRQLLAGSVKSRLVSDVPVGAFLSGGIDSSVVVGLMAEVSTSRPNSFTVSFDEKEFDESRYADIIARKFNTNHTSIHLTPSVFLDELELALQSMDTPSGDGVNSYVVSKAIRNAGITVALSGTGGDELFAGYPIFRQFVQMQKYKDWWKGMGMMRSLAAMFLNISPSNRKSRMRQILRAGSPSVENIYPVLRQVLSPDIIGQLTNLKEDAFSTGLSRKLAGKSGELEQLPLLSQVSAAEYLGYTQHTLLKDMDQMSMAVSLEVREPFFDHELVEFVLSVPDNIKMPVYPKSLLVESVKPLLPDEIVHRKKQGFLFPWNFWMKNELRTFCETKISHLSQRTFIHEARLRDYWQRFLKNDPSVRWSEVWLFIVLEHWMEKNNIHE